MRCRNCGAGELSAFFDGGPVPVLCNRLWPTREEALAAPRGAMRLGLCRACGAVFNTAFDPAQMRYSAAYENSLHFSPVFQAYAEELATRWTRRHGLAGKRVLEIGCGKGDFLRMIARLGAREAVGFDASYEGPERAADGDARMLFVRSDFEPSHPEAWGDAIVCRHVLEHIPQPLDFLAVVREVAARRPGAVVLFEVPDLLWALRDLGIWDLIYEHCSYYSPHALARTFETAGFRVLGVESAYHGQFVRIAAALDGSERPFEAGPDPEEIGRLAGAFADAHRLKVASWNERLGRALDRGEAVAIWGAGSKGVTFLNTMARGVEIGHVVDINPRKRGRHVPGTGQPVVAPEELAGLPLDVVLVMNAIYRDEIGRALEAIGIRPRLELV